MANPFQRGWTTFVQRNWSTGISTFEMNDHRPLSAGEMTLVQAVETTVANPFQRGWTTPVQKSASAGARVPVTHDQRSDRAGWMTLVQAFEIASPVAIAPSRRVRRKSTNAESSSNPNRFPSKSPFVRRFQTDWIPGSRVPEIHSQTAEMAG